MSPNARFLNSNLTTPRKSHKLHKRSRRHESSQKLLNYIKSNIRKLRLKSPEVQERTMTSKPIRKSRQRAKNTLLTRNIQPVGTPKSSERATRDGLSGFQSPTQRGADSSQGFEETLSSTFAEFSTIKPQKREFDDLIPKVKKARIRYFLGESPGALNRTIDRIRNQRKKYKFVVKSIENFPNSASASRKPKPTHLMADNFIYSYFLKFYPLVIT